MIGTVNFDHFQILRAIGKGSFGKVRALNIPHNDGSGIHLLIHTEKQHSIHIDAEMLFFLRH